MNNADFWESINGIVADGFTPEGLQRLDHYAELLINGRLVYKRFSPFEQHGCAAGGTTHVVASILAGAETAPTNKISNSEKSVKLNYSFCAINSVSFTYRQTTECAPINWGRLDSSFSVKAPRKGIRAPMNQFKYSKERRVWLLRRKVHGLRADDHVAERGPDERRVSEYGSIQLLRMDPTKGR